MLKLPWTSGMEMVQPGADLIRICGDGADQIQLLAGVWLIQPELLADTTM